MKHTQKKTHTKIIMFNNIYLKIDNRNNLLQHSDCNIGYWRLQKGFHKKPQCRNSHSLRAEQSKGIIQIWKNTQHNTERKSLTHNINNIKNIPDGEINLNDYLGKNVFKTGLLQKLKVIFGKYEVIQ